MYALQVTSVPAKRCLRHCTGVQFTRFCTSAEDSGVSFRRIASYSTDGNLNVRSNPIQQRPGNARI